MGPETENIHLIPLTKGQFARVDAEDWEPLMKFKWQAFKSKRSKRFCATRGGAHPDGSQTTIYMHREIMGLGVGDSAQVDHRDLDDLNNRRHNLRLANNGQNQQNRQVTKRNRLGIKGVWQISPNRYRAGITAAGIAIDLGVFPTPETASEAYNRAATTYHGEFARLG